MEYQDNGVYLDISAAQLLNVRKDQILLFWTHKKFVNMRSHFSRMLDKQNIPTASGNDGNETRVESTTYPIYFGIS